MQSGQLHAVFKDVFKDPNKTCRFFVTIPSLDFPTKIGSAHQVKIRGEPELKILRIHLIVLNRNRGKIKFRAYCCYVFLHRKPYDPNMPQGELLSRSNVFLLLKGQGSLKKKFDRMVEE